MPFRFLRATLPFAFLPALLPAQTPPPDPDRLHIAPHESLPDTFRLSWWSTAGRLAWLESSPDLSFGSWTLSSYPIAQDESWTEAEPFSVDPWPGRYFFRLRHVDYLRSPATSDLDHDGVKMHDELPPYSTDPFSYPDTDPTDADTDGLPDVWEWLRLGSLDHAGSEMAPLSTLTYLQHYQAGRADQDDDGLPDDWEIRTLGTTTRGPAELWYFGDGVTLLTRFQADRAQFSRPRYGGQTFFYDESKTENPLHYFGLNNPSAPDPREVFFRGDGGGSLRLTYTDTTYARIASVRVWPSNRDYGAPRFSGDPATHHADYAGSPGPGGWSYVFSATPASGAFVARDLLRALDARPLRRATGGPGQVLRPATLAITSLPVTVVSPTAFPIIVRDFTYEDITHPDFGTLHFFATLAPFPGMVAPRLDPAWPAGRPSFALAPDPSRSIRSAHSFAPWYRHENALGYLTGKNPYPAGWDEDHLPPSSFSHGITNGAFFPHQNDVGVLTNGETWTKFRQGFTTELHLRLDYDLATTKLFIQSDDDLWVFIDGKLAVDSGGVHIYRHNDVRNDAHHQAHPSEAFYQYSLNLLKADMETALGETVLTASTGSCRISIYHADREKEGATLTFLATTPVKPIYAYQVVAESEYGQLPLSYELLAAPAGMTIDAQGKILWDYHAAGASAGSYPVTIRVSDPLGRSDTQSFNLQITL